MACVNSDKFSASDLSIFIESIEQITRMERKKKERMQQHRAQYLADTLRYLDQQYPARSSSTLSSTDEPEDESVLENIEEKEIACHYAVKDLIYDSTYEEKQVSYDECTGAAVQNEYCQIGDCDDYNQCADVDYSFASGIYSMPLDCLESTKISRSASYNNVYEQINSSLENILETSHGSSTSYVEPLEVETTAVMDSYTEPMEVLRKKSFKKTLLGLVCKKYRKRNNSKNANSSTNWCKSESWMKLSAF